MANLGILMSPEYVDLRSSLIKALDPAARRAVGEVLAAVEGKAPHFPGRLPPPQAVNGGE
jgi:hypothetical protein